MYSLDDEDRGTSGRLIPILSLSCEDSCVGLVKRLHYDHSGLAKLSELLEGGEATSSSTSTSSSPATRRSFNPEDGIQIACLQQHHIVCYGIWGGRQDIREFMLDHHGFSAVSSRVVRLSNPCPIDLTDGASG